MNKYLIWAGVGVLVLAVGGLVWVTFKNNLPSTARTLPPITSSPSPWAVNTAQPVGLDTLVGNPGQVKGSYVLTGSSGKLYVRATVEKWNSQSLLLRIRDKKSEVAVTNPASVLCQPQYLTDEGGNRVLSSQVYIDVTNYKGNPPQVALAKVKTAFPVGSDIALTAAKVGDVWQADILIGFGCSL